MRAEEGEPGNEASLVYVGLIVSATIFSQISVVLLQYFVSGLCILSAISLLVCVCIRLHSEGVVEFVLSTWDHRSNEFRGVACASNVRTHTHTSSLPPSAEA